MVFVLRKNQKKFFYLFILLLPFYLFFVRSYSFIPFKFKVIEAFSSSLQVISIPFKEVKKILFYHRTFDEYFRLQKEMGFLKGRLIGFEEVVLENVRLEKLLSFKRNLIYSSVAASVIGRDPTHWHSTMIIDRGTKDGVALGMPVVNSFGVVGKIAEASENTSKVLLITDPQFSVAAMIKRLRETALVSGALNHICRVRYINEDAQVEVGDLVITSKLSSSFPEGLMLGEIIRVEQNEQNATQEGVLEPAVSLSQLEEVLVILNK